MEFSVRAQDFLLKHGAVGRTADDLSLFGGLQSADTTNASVALPDSAMRKGSKANLASTYGLDSLGPVALPRLVEKDKSPFKGFLDISLATQKMRKGISTQANGRTHRLRNIGFHSVKGGANPLAKSGSTHPFKAREGNFLPKGGDDYQLSATQEPLLAPSHVRGNSERAPASMSPKVLETWINETLQEAEHLDIPGVVLKPEHKNPISRYGVDRLELT